MPKTRPRGAPIGPFWPAVAVNSPLLALLEPLFGQFQREVHDAMRILPCAALDGQGPTAGVAPRAKPYASARAWPRAIPGRPPYDGAHTAGAAAFPPLLTPAPVLRLPRSAGAAELASACCVESSQCELRIKTLPRNRVNKGKKKEGPRLLRAPGPYSDEGLDREQEARPKGGGVGATLSPLYHPFAAHYLV
jgi:hypothetical protein